MPNKDIFEKVLVGYNDVFADIVNVFLFQGERLVQENELSDAQARSYYKADGQIREQERDVSKYWRKSKIKVAVLGIENQTEDDADMPLRVIGYDGAAYRNQLKKDAKERYPVTTLVLYFNYKKRWSKPLNLVDCFAIPEELKPYVNDYRVHLFEIAYLSREQVEMFQSDFKIVADFFVQMRENNDYIPSKETIYHVQEVLQFMAVMNQDMRFEDAYREEGSGSNMCEYLDRLEARGEARGEVSGKIKGIIETCLEFGMDTASILDKIMRKFQLEEHEARKYMEEINEKLTGL